MANTGKLELSGQLGLIPQLTLDALHANLVAIHHDLRRRCSERVRTWLRTVHGARRQRGDESAHSDTDGRVRADLRFGNLRVTRVVRRSGKRVDIDVVPKGVIRLQSCDVVIRAQVVRIGKSEVRVPVDTLCELIEEPWQAVVGRVALGEVKVADRQPCRLVHAEGYRWRDAKAAILCIGP